MDIKRLRILLGPFIISWAPIFFLLISGMTAGSIAGWRFVLGGLLLLAFQIVRGRQIPRPNQWMFLGSVAFAMDIYLWHHSILSIGGGLATVLANTQVIYMSLISLRQKEFDRPGLVISSAVIGLLGVFLLFYDRIFSSVGVTPGIPLFDRVEGLVFGLVAGMLYTMFLICFSKAQNFDRVTRSNKISAIQTLTWVSLMGGCGILFFEAILAAFHRRAWGELFPSNAHQFFWLLILAGVIHVGGWVELGNALNHFKKATMGLILLLQPVMATVWAWWLFNERMNHLQLWGALLIFLSLIIIRVAETKKSAS